MNPTPHPPSSKQTPNRHVIRAGSAVLAAVLALGLWIVATQLLGVEVRSPEMGDEPAADISFLNVVVASLVASVAAWGLLAILERFTPRARTAWLTISVIVLVVSLGAPLTGEGITAANRTVLTLLHIAVGGVLMGGLTRTTSTERQSPDRAGSAEREGASR